MNKLYTIVLIIYCGLSSILFSGIQKHTDINKVDYQYDEKVFEFEFCKLIFNEKMTYHEIQKKYSNNTGFTAWILSLYPLGMFKKFEDIITPKKKTVKEKFKNIFVLNNNARDKVFNEVNQLIGDLINSIGLRESMEALVGRSKQKNKIDLMTLAKEVVCKRSDDEVKKIAFMLAKMLLALRTFREINGIRGIKRGTITEYKRYHWSLRELVFDHLKFLSKKLDELDTILWKWDYTEVEL